MIQTIQLIKLCYPFIILAVFFCLYKKDNRITRKFCWRMTMTHSARKLFVIAVLASLILMNWCCYMTDPNWAVLLAAIMTGCLFSNKVADRVLNRLHERKRFWTLTLMLALVCYSIPYMNSIFHVLYSASHQERGEQHQQSTGTASADHPLLLLKCHLFVAYCLNTLAREISES